MNTYFWTPACGQNLETNTIIPKRNTTEGLLCCEGFHPADISDQSTASIRDTSQLFQPGEDSFFFLFSLTTVELQARIGRSLLFHYRKPPHPSKKTKKPRASLVTQPASQRDQVSATSSITLEPFTSNEETRFRRTAFNFSVHSDETPQVFVPRRSTTGREGTSGKLQSRTG